MKRRTLSFKLIMLLLLIFVPISLFSLYHYRSMVIDHKHDIRMRESAVADGIAGELREIIEKSIAVIHVLAVHPAVIAKNSAECDRLFAKLLPANPLQLNIIAADMDGRNYASGVQPAGARELIYADKEWFQRARQGEFVVGDMHLSKLFKKPTVMIAGPVFNQHGDQVAVLGLPLDLSKMRDSLSRTRRLPEQYSIVVVDSRGDVLIHSLHPELTGTNARHLPHIAKAIESGTGTAENIGSDGIRRLYSFTSVPRADWRVSVGIPIEHAYSHAYSFGRSFLFMTLLLLSFSLGMVLRVTRKPVKDLTVLLSGIREIGEGNLLRRIVVTGADEIADVADAVNSMAARRRETEEQVHAMNRSLRTVNACNEALVRATNEQELLRTICETFVTKGGYRMSWVGYAEYDDPKNVHPAAAAGIDPSVFEAYTITWDDAPTGQGPVGTAIRTGVTVVFSDILNNPSFKQWREAAAQQGYQSVIALPLRNGTGVFGALSLYASRPDAFGEDETQLLTGLANNLSYGITALRVRQDRERQELFIGTIFESMGEGLVVIDRDYRIVAANQEYCRQAGRAQGDVVGNSCYEVSHHIPRHCREVDIECAPYHTFQTGMPYAVVHEHRDAEGNTFYHEVKSYPIRDESGEVRSVIEITADITERRKLEDQLRHAQRLETVGTLAGGVAHDFNNILTAIIGYTHVALMKMKGDDPVRHELEQVLEASERATTLTQGLLAFSRKQPVMLRMLDTNDVIRKFEKFLKRLVREDIMLRTICVSAPLPILADQGQIEQVFMNLVANARDAMPRGGTLTIETGLVSLDQEFIKMHGYGKTGEYALIMVTDTGEGMDDSTRVKIFDPFYTTKEQGKGTGLGLATVYGIVKKHDGFINVYSEVGKGSVFKIYLPIMRTAQVKEQPVTPGTAAPVIGGTETILIAEDDVSLRQLTASVLEQFGYRVLAAVDGADAVRVFFANKDSIDLALLDGIMPKKNGKAALDEIRSVRPGMKALFMSGYREGAFADQAFTDQSIPCILKPISPKELLSKIREVLDRP